MLAALLSVASATDPYDGRFADGSDLLWVDAPNAWHQQLARIVDHRFSSFDELLRFARGAKRAGVSALMLVDVQKTSQCPGPWYNGLQLCDHINGSFPAADGSLERWRQMLDEIRPMRLMWWTNPAYWSVQGQVWAAASANRFSDVGSWFSWGPEDCSGVPPCMGRNVVVPGTGCAQGSWGSESGYSGVKSALASYGSSAYADYMVDSMANSWARNLGIDGFCEDVAAHYGCMLQTQAGQGSIPEWRSIVERVRRAQPQVVMSGESYGSWADVIRSDADMGGQGHGGYHDAMQRAVLSGDASGLEGVASTSGADAASVLCYLHPHYDGRQPGGCPTMYFRDMTATLKDPRRHLMWVALEAGSGIVSQHDYDPESSCAGWEGCSYWSHDRPGAWWNVTNDPPLADGSDSPLWAFTRERALNRLALRTKMTILATSPSAASPTDGGALVYLKHDAMGPDGDACLMIFNPGRAQQLTIDLSQLPAAMLSGTVVPRDLLRRTDDRHGTLAPPLAPHWSVWMGEGEVKAFGGFTLGTFAPRRGKKAGCVADDRYSKRAVGTSLQACFLECLRDAQCEHVHVEYVDIIWMERPPPLSCTLLGALRDPSRACSAGTGTLIAKLPHGRPRDDHAASAHAPPPPPELQQSAGASPSGVVPPEELSAYRAGLLRDRSTYDVSAVPLLPQLPVLTTSNTEEHAEWHAYIRRVYGHLVPFPVDLNEFTWFYWSAPLRPGSILLVDWIDQYEAAPYGIPWTGGVAAWDWGPEHLVRRAGFFVHRPRWPTAAYVSASRLEVMRIGPIAQYGFEEGQESLWFYHALGSGVYVRPSAFRSLEVHYEQHMTVPRIEIVGHLPAAAVQPRGTRSRAEAFWPPSIAFEVQDGAPCASTSIEHRILSCSNLPMPLWLGDDDPDEELLRAAAAEEDKMFLTSRGTIKI